MSQFDGNVTVGGQLQVQGAIVLKTQSLSGTAINPAVPVPTGSVTHQNRKGYSQPNTTATTETRTLYRVRGATASLKEFFAGSIAINAGAATVTLDLKKNGTTLLSSVLTLNSSNTARVPVNATLLASPTALVAGDVLEVVITATAGGGTLATGVDCGITVDEDPV